MHPLFEEFGAAGKRLTDLGMCDGTAGNLSVCLRDPGSLSSFFSATRVIRLPEAAPELAGAAFLVTGSGVRLREIERSPLANAGLIVVRAGGLDGILYTHGDCRFDRVTVEFNTHLAVHREMLARHGFAQHAVVHAQPFHLTYLSHQARYRDFRFLNQRILRWEPESIYHLREGVGIVPFFPPASEGLQRATTPAMNRHRVVVWAKHGVIARSEQGLAAACDLIEFAEVGARFECLHNAQNEADRDAQAGLTMDDIQALCVAFNIDQNIFSFAQE